MLNVDGVLIQYDFLISEITNQIKTVQSQINGLAINDISTSSININSNSTEDQHQKSLKKNSAFHSNLNQVTQWELTRL